MFLDYILQLYSLVVNNNLHEDIVSINLNCMQLHVSPICSLKYAPALTVQILQKPEIIFNFGCNLHKPFRMTHSKLTL